MGEYVARRGSARLPIRARVVVKYPGVDEVFEEVTADIGMAGMFVCGESPMPPGTLMHFELRPAENWRLLKGRGRVVWAQQRAETGRPAGMGVRFVELEERARRAIRWLIETHQEDESRPFESWTVPAQFARSKPALAPADMLATQEIPPLAPEEPRRRWLPIAAGTAGALLIGWFAWGLRDAGLGSGGRKAAIEAETPERPAAPVEEPVDATASLVQAEPAADADATAVEAPEPAPEIDLTEVLGTRIQAWASAWSSQDPDSYLAFYALDFAPADGTGFDAWQAQRRQRLTAPEFIQVEVDDVQLLDEETDRPSTVFSQRYTSNTFQDQVTKSLTWQQIDGRWRIVAERSAP